MMHAVQQPPKPSVGEEAEEVTKVKEAVVVVQEESAAKVEESGGGNEGEKEEQQQGQEETTREKYRKDSSEVGETDVIVQVRDAIDYTVLFRDTVFGSSISISSFQMEEEDEADDDLLDLGSNPSGLSEDEGDFDDGDLTVNDEEDDSDDDEDVSSRRSSDISALAQLIAVPIIVISTPS